MSRKKKTAIGQEISLLSQERKHVLGSGSGFYSREAYNTLRTNITFSLADVEGSRVIMITSGMQSEGKSITAVNLALSLAEAGSRVILVDCDMRRPKIGRLLDLTAEAGLSNILVNTPLLRNNIVSFRGEIDVIVAGSIPPNPSELLSSDRMKSLLTALRKHYDYVILDTPPVNMVTDAVTLSPQADGVLFVVRTDSSERGSVIRGVEQLEYANAKLIGFAMTCVPLEQTSYGYGKYRYKKYARYGYKKYGYGYGYGGYGYGYGYGSGKKGDREEWRAALHNSAEQE